MGDLRPFVEGVVQVRDGRRLGFAEFGRPHGRAVVWLHGTPGARRQIPVAARLAAEELDVRLIGIDRPGVGSSTPHGYDQVLDFADDLCLAFDRLGIDEFAALGLSGGGPYALSCAAAMPDRVQVVGVLGGVAPSVGPDAAPGGVVSLAARFAPAMSLLREPLALAVASLVWAARPFAVPAISAYAWLSPEHDRQLLSRPEIRAMFLDDLLNGSRPGLRAPIYDAVLFGRPWGFSVRDLTVPVHWWHGDADHIIPAAHGEHVAALIPGARFHVRPGESHLSGLGAAEEVLTTVLATWDERDGATPGGRNPRRRAAATT